MLFKTHNSSSEHKLRHFVDELWEVSEPTIFAATSLQLLRPFAERFCDRWSICLYEKHEVYRMNAVGWFYLVRWNKENLYWADLLRQMHESFSANTSVSRGFSQRFFVFLLAFGLLSEIGFMLNWKSNYWALNQRMLSENKDPEGI